MQLEIILSILIPLGGATIFIVRHFWKKEKCLVLMKQKITHLSEESSGSHDTHGNLYDKINNLGTRISVLETKMDLIITHFHIKSD